MNLPFDVTYHITFQGKTQGDGVPTVTSAMIRDKIIAVLDEMIHKKYISEYSISAELNNIKEAKKVIKRNK